MPYLPSENFYIISPLKTGEVRSRLEKKTAPSKISGYKAAFAEFSPAAYFYGNVAQNTFEIKRIIDYRNALLPEIKGTTEPFLNGTRVHIWMKPSGYASVFTGIWFVVTGLLTIGISILDIVTKQLNRAPLMPAGFFAFAYVLTPRSFNAESRLAKNKLREMFDGNIE